MNLKACITKATQLTNIEKTHYHQEIFVRLEGTMKSIFSIRDVEGAMFKLQFLEKIKSSVSENKVNARNHFASLGIAPDKGDMADNNDEDIDFSFPD